MSGTTWLLGLSWLATETRFDCADSMDVREAIEGRGAGSADADADGRGDGSVEGRGCVSVVGETC